MCPYTTVGDHHRETTEQEEGRCGRSCPGAVPRSMERHQDHLHGLDRLISAPFGSIRCPDEEADIAQQSPTVATVMAAIRMTTPGWMASIRSCRTWSAWQMSVSAGLGTAASHAGHLTCSPGAGVAYNQHFPAGRGAGY